MGRKTYLAQLHIATVNTLDTVPTGFVALSAKADGLYMKAAGGMDNRILNKEDLLALQLGDSSHAGQIQFWDPANEVWMNITVEDYTFSFNSFSISNIATVQATTGYFGSLILTATKPAKQFLASPTATTGAPSFRAIVPGDLPALPYAPENTFIRVLADRTTIPSALTSISDFSMDLTAGEVYHFEVHLGFNSNNASGINFAIAYYGGYATLEASITGNASATAGKTLRINAFSTPAGVFGTSLNGSVLLLGIIAPTVSGPFNIQFQKISSGTATIYKNSYMRITKL